MWLFAGLPLLPPCLVLGSPEVDRAPLAPPGLSRAEGSPPSTRWQSFCRCSPGGCRTPVPKDNCWLTSTLYLPGAPAFFLQNCFPSGQTPEYSSTWIYFFPGGGLHTPFSEHCVVPGHHFFPSEWPHSTLEYQTLLPAFFHLQSKFQTQIYMKWMEPEEV